MRQIVACSRPARSRRVLRGPADRGAGGGRADLAGGAAGAGAAGVVVRRAAVQCAATPTLSPGVASSGAGCAEDRRRVAARARWASRGCQPDGAGDSAGGTARARRALRGSRGGVRLRRVGSAQGRAGERGAQSSAGLFGDHTGLAPGGRQAVGLVANDVYGHAERPGAGAHGGAAVGVAGAARGRRAGEASTGPGRHASVRRAPGPASSRGPPVRHDLLSRRAQGSPVPDGVPRPRPV